MIKIIDVLIQNVSRLFPNLNLKLKHAGMAETPEEFIKKALISALFFSFSISLFLWLVLSKLGQFTQMIIMMLPILFLLAFFYLFKMPDVKINKKIKEIDSEIVFAGRFLIIELESGVPLYDSFKNDWSI